MTTRIWIVEEYGYRHWLWVHPGSREDVQIDWNAGRRPVNFWGLRDSYSGTCTQFDPHDDIRGLLDAGILTADEVQLKLAHAALDLSTSPEALEQLLAIDGKAHVHEEDDTWLKFSS